jgi:hypothetical protein
MEPLSLRSRKSGMRSGNSPASRMLLLEKLTTKFWTWTRVLAMEDAVEMAEARRRHKAAG